MDIRELRIGSSVLCNGVRAKVSGLQTWDFKGKPLYHVKVKGISPETCEEMEVGGFADKMQPIPITEELLKELGFECLWGVPKEMEKHIGEIGLYSTHLNNGKYRISISNDDSTNYGNILCQHLHELEQFVFLACKKELF